MDSSIPLWCEGAGDRRVYLFFGDRSASLLHVAQAVQQSPALEFAFDFTMSCYRHTIDLIDDDPALAGDAAIHISWEIKWRQLIRKWQPKLLDPIESVLAGMGFEPKHCARVEFPAVSDVVGGRIVASLSSSEPFRDGVLFKVCPEFGIFTHDNGWTWGLSGSK